MQPAQAVRPSDVLLSRGFQQSVSVKVDSKGRISIPAWVRRNFLLSEGSDVLLSFDLRKPFILFSFENGQDGVEERRPSILPSNAAKESLFSTRGCGPLRAGSKALPDDREPEYPAPGLEDMEADNG